MSRYINDDIVVTDRLPADAISEDQFKRELCNAVLTNLGQDEYDEMVEDETDPLPWGHAVSKLLNRDRRLYMEKDIEIDHENITMEWDEWDIKFSGDAEPAQYLGIHTINGLTFCGVLTGGDWEHPIFLILYWHNGNIHVYIPKRGNLVNMDAKTAFGSENEEFEAWAWLSGERLSALGKEALATYKILGLCDGDIDEDDFSWSGLYIKKYGYSLNKNGYVDTPFNWEAMMDEISAVFTVI